MNKTLLALLCILLSTRAFASHVAGADLRYEFNGTNYTLYLTVNADCGGISSPPVQGVNVKSVSTSTNMNIICSLASTTILPACPTALTTCQSSSATLPGFKRLLYTGTVSLAAANDWVISFTTSARSGAIVNLSYPAGQDLYVETKLDNSVAI